MHNGLQSKFISRRLEVEAGRNIELMWLLRKLRPDYRTTAEFRRQNKEAIQEVSHQLVLLCKKWNLFGMEVVAVDGSKFKACNSKENNSTRKADNIFAVCVIFVL